MLYIFPSKQWRIDAYYRIPSDSASEYVKQIIYQFGTILVGSNWYNSWMSRFGLFPKPDYVVGGHAYRIIGWNKTGFVVANSWGDKLWGVKGYATMSFAQFKKVLGESDCWKLVDSK